MTILRWGLKFSFECPFRIRCSYIGVPKSNASLLTRAPLALQIFHHLLERGFEHPPSISAPISRREKRKKRSKAHQKFLRNYPRQFFTKVKIVAPRAQKMAKFSSFFFAIVKHRFGKPPLPREL